MAAVRRDVVNRRKALRKISLGASAGLLLPLVLPSCKEEDETPVVNYNGTILVVGAGAAGLYTADLLMNQGLNVSVLEASDRVGGRVLSVRGFDDFPVELGASEIRTENSLLLKMAQELNLPTTDLASGTKNKFFLNGQTKTADELASDPAFAAATQFISSITSYDQPGSTLMQAIEQSGLSTEVWQILEGQLGEHLGSDNDRISINGIKSAVNLPDNRRALALPANPAQDLLTSRFVHVLDYVYFNTKVSAIDYTGEKVTVATDKGSLTADKVVLTVPVSIMKSGAISFSPALPEDKLGALSRTGMDAAVTVLIRFNRNFWGSDTFKIFGGSLVPVYVAAGKARSDRNRTLIIQAFGNDAEILASLSDDALKAAITKDLDSMFDNNASTNNEITALLRKDWQGDEFTQGGFSYPLAGGSENDRIILSTHIDNKLYFAGEATSVNGNFGTVHGALESAERVAQEVLQSITKE